MPDENVIKKVIRTVVKEELKVALDPFKNEIITTVKTLNGEFRSEVKTLNEALRSDIAVMRDEIVTSNDEVAGEIKAMREEQDTHAAIHERLDEEIEELQSIHPQGQHITP